MATSNQSQARAIVQPLAVLAVPDALLTIRTTCAVTGQSESSLRRGVKAGTFPSPVKRGARCTRFVAADVSAWLASQRNPKLDALKSLEALEQAKNAASRQYAERRAEGDVKPGGAK
ncbi:MAG: AlpA family phage regulatory protein [Pseudomonadota bacterium]